MMDRVVAYHENQFKTPYRSTEVFDDFLSLYKELGGVKVLDLACGGGANEFYFGKKYSNSQWVGMDIDDTYFSLFKKYGSQLDNVSLIKGDWFDLSESFIGEFDGIISLQALSWLPEWEKPIQEICKIKPKWMAFSSLFYDGNIEYITKVHNYERPDYINGSDHTDAFYNVYSIPRIKNYLVEQGYNFFVAEPFQIDIDLPKPNNKDWGTYTVPTKTEGRLQISGAMLMPWWFIYAERIDT